MNMKTTGEDPKYYKFMSKELSKNGWIDKRGNFYPCDFTCHNDLMDELQANGAQEEVRDFETSWIKVSTGIFTGITAFVTIAKVLTGKQKVTIEKIIKKYDMHNSHFFLSTCGGYHLSYINKEIKWEKEDEC